VSAWERSTVRLTLAAALGLGLADVLDQAKAREVLALVVIQPRDDGAVTDAAANLQLQCLANVLRRNMLHRTRFGKYGKH
jgi:hypothetical protein